MSTRLLFFWALFFAMGCSDGNGGSGSASDWSATCQSESKFRERCQKQGEGDLCSTYGQSCVSRIYRSDAAEPVRKCIDSLECAGSIEDCYEKTTLSRSSAAANWKTACEARLAQCQPEFGPDEQFFCFDLSSATDEYIAI